MTAPSTLRYYPDSKPGIARRRCGRGFSYHAPDGRCISLLKILLTNHCVFDCHYCVNRKSSNVRRARFTPQEVADLTLSFYRRNYIEGLFLSSGIIRNSDHTMEQLVETDFAKTLIVAGLLYIFLESFKSVPRCVSFRFSWFRIGIDAAAGLTALIFQN